MCLYKSFYTCSYLKATKARVKGTSRVHVRAGGELGGRIGKRVLAELTGRGGNCRGLAARGHLLGFKKLSETKCLQGGWSRNASETLRQAYGHYLCLPIFAKLAFCGCAMN